MKTKRDIDYACYGHKVTIPKGTPVIEASNLPDGEYFFWVEPWENMGILADSWQRNYGFLVDADEVTPE